MCINVVGVIDFFIEGDPWHEGRPHSYKTASMYNVVRNLNAQKLEFGGLVGSTTSFTSNVLLTIKNSIRLRSASK
jgi:hypothetical protein